MQRMKNSTSEALGKLKVTYGRHELKTRLFICFIDQLGFSVSANKVFLSFLSYLFAMEPTTLRVILHLSTAKARTQHELASGCKGQMGPILL